MTFEGITATGTNVVDCKDGDPCDADGTSNGACQFAISVCVNQPPCTPVTVSKIQNARLFTLPALPATAPACAAAKNVEVKLRGKGKKPGKRQIRTIARTNGTPKKDTDHFRLRCLPGGGGGGGGTVPGDRTFTVNSADSEFVSSVTGGNIADVQGVTGSLALTAGTPDANGVASLTLGAASYLGVKDIGGGFNCFKIEPEATAGKIDCDGGTPVNVLLTQDSGGTGPETGPPVLSVEQGPPGAAGDAYLPVKVTAVSCGGPQPTPNGCPGGTPTSADQCAAKVDFAKGGTYDTALTTGRATGQVTNSRQGGTVTNDGQGVAFSCTTWSSNGPGTLVMPVIGLDIAAAGNIDTVNVLKAVE